MKRLDFINSFLIKYNLIINLIVLFTTIFIDFFLIKYFFFTYLYIPIIIFISIKHSFKNKINLLYLTFPVFLYFLSYFYEYKLNNYLIGETKKEIFYIENYKINNNKYPKFLSNKKNFKKVLGYSIYYISKENNVVIELDLFNKYEYYYNFINKNEEINDVSL